MEKIIYNIKNLSSYVIVNLVFKTTIVTKRPTFVKVNPVNIMQFVKQKLIKIQYFTHVFVNMDGPDKIVIKF